MSSVFYVCTNMAIEPYERPQTGRFYRLLHQRSMLMPKANELANSSSATEPLPTIYVITPTYRRLEQIADLTRLAQTLTLVPSVHWIVVEDDDGLSPHVSELLERYPIPHTHLYGNNKKSCD